MTSGDALARADETQSFQVDLRGVVDLLGRHIYSSPRVFLRELLQNACDAISARKEVDAGGGRIWITALAGPDSEFVLRDDGVGLTAEDVTSLLATVGRSSKRDIFDLPRSDYLGQFGIGLLSCFMVAEEIRIRSRSARGGAPVEWIGHSDGTFTMRELYGSEAATVPVGTSVHLRPRFDQTDLLSYTAVLDMATTFGQYLPVPIDLDSPSGGTVRVTEDAPFLPEAELGARVAFGTALVGSTPLDVIDLRIPATNTVGTAYVLPFAPPPGARQATRLYLGQMLLSERAENVLPEWAFFVRAALTSTGLSPTASRESLVADDSLEHTREQIGGALRRWVLDLGLSDPGRLAQFVGVHELGLKSLVRHDEELARFITRWLSVETSLGRMSIGELVGRFNHVRYAETVDEYRQVVGITDTTTPLVNGGYLYDGELIRMLPELFSDVTVERIDVNSELDRLDPVPLDDRDAGLDLERRAGEVLTTVGCDVAVRAIGHPTVAALYIADPEVLRRVDRDRTRKAGGALWGSVMDRLDSLAGDRRESAAQPRALRARVCLNWDNRVVRTLAATTDAEVFASTVRLLYVQSLLDGQRPLAHADRVLMTAAITDLVERSVDVTADVAVDLAVDTSGENEES